jgi:thioredoxin 1
MRSSRHARSRGALAALLGLFLSLLPALPLRAAENPDPNVLVVTDSSFDKDVLKSAGPVLVDFWSSWCTCCRQVSSSISRMADHYKGSLTVAKVNVEDNPAVPRRYGVSGLPTVLVFNNGKLVKKWVGTVAEDSIKKEVLSLMKPATGGPK